MRKRGRIEQGGPGVKAVHARRGSWLVVGFVRFELLPFSSNNGGIYIFSFPEPSVGQLLDHVNIGGSPFSDVGFPVCPLSLSSLFIRNICMCICIHVCTNIYIYT